MPTCMTDGPKWLYAPLSTSISPRMADATGAVSVQLPSRVRKAWRGSVERELLLTAERDLDRAAALARERCRDRLVLRHFRLRTEPAADCDLPRDDLLRFSPNTCAISFTTKKRRLRRGPELEALARLCPTRDAMFCSITAWATRGYQYVPSTETAPSRRRPLHVAPGAGARQRRVPLACLALVQARAPGFTASSIVSGAYLDAVAHRDLRQRASASSSLSAATAAISSPT